MVPGSRGVSIGVSIRVKVLLPSLPYAVTAVTVLLMFVCFIKVIKVIPKNISYHPFVSICERFAHCTNQLTITLTRSLLAGSDFACPNHLGQALTTRDKTKQKPNPRRTRCCHSSIKCVRCLYPSYVTVPYSCACRLEQCLQPCFHPSIVGS